MIVRELMEKLAAMPQDAQVRVNAIEAVTPETPPLDRSHDGERVAQAPVTGVEMLGEVCWIEAEG